MGRSSSLDKPHLGNFFQGWGKVLTVVSPLFLLAMFEQRNSPLFMILSLLFKVQSILKKRFNIGNL